MNNVSNSNNNSEMYYPSPRQREMLKMEFAYLGSDEEDQIKGQKELDKLQRDILNGKKTKQEMDNLYQNALTGLANNVSRMQEWEEKSTDDSRDLMNLIHEAEESVKDEKPNS